MREFLGGWRRKVGYGLLVATCVLAWMWIRSLGTTDQWEVFYDDHSLQRVYSCHGGLRWHTYFDPETVYPWKFRSRWKSYPASETKELHIRNANRSWVWNGFYVAEDWSRSRRTGTTDLCRIWVIPYWSLAIPLIGLSACLILWRPRTRPPETVVSGSPS